MELIRSAEPRLPGNYVPHVPHKGPQHLLLLLDHVLEVFYGGAAGGGKSDGLLMSALQYVDVPGYAALILRRTWADLIRPGALMERANKWLRRTDAKAVAGGRSWVFPSGARLDFGYVMNPRDVENFASAEYQFIGIDELSRGWTLREYEFMFSRLRKPDWQCSNCGVPVMRTELHAVPGERVGWIHKRTVERDDGPVVDIPWPEHRDCTVPSAALFEETPPNLPALPDVPLRMRSGSNPGGSGHEWVKKLFVDPETRRESAVFIPATLDDNPSINRAQYIASLKHLGAVELERLLKGDWEVVEEGSMFRRWWFPVIEPGGVPADCRWIRYWDLAASNPKTLRNSQDPDWSVGALVGVTRQGQWILADVVRIQGTPLEVERLIAHTAARDGRHISVVMEQEPGSAGVNTIDHYRRNVLLGYHFDGDRPSGEKPVRARPWSSAAEAGNFKLVKGRWNDAFLDEAELFPVGAHDDQVDAVSGAVKVLSTGRARLIV